MPELPRNVDVTALRDPTLCNFECRYITFLVETSILRLLSCTYIKPADYNETALHNIAEVSNVGPETPFPLRVKDNFPQLFELLTVQKQWKQTPEFKSRIPVFLLSVLFMCYFGNDQVNYWLKWCIVGTHPVPVCWIGLTIHCFVDHLQ
jgi:hypothetical protein